MRGAVVARGEATESSDLDLLVEWEPGRGLFDHAGLKLDLEDLLGVRVEIGSERALHWFIRDGVIGEAVLQYVNQRITIVTVAMTFGKTISEARKRLDLSQKDLAARIKKDGGKPISAQYLNDIEHDRRNAPTGSLIEEFARELKLDKDFLAFVAGTLPEDLQNAVARSPERVAEAIKAFRRTMKGT